MKKILLLVLLVLLVLVALSYGTITQGIYTIGTGGNYPTLSKFRQAVGENLTGNLTGIIISAFTDTGYGRLTGSATLYLNGYTYTEDGQGYKVTINRDSTYLVTDFFGPGTVEEKNRYFALATSTTFTHPNTLYFRTPIEHIDISVSGGTVLLHNNKYWGARCSNVQCVILDQAGGDYYSYRNIEGGCYAWPYMCEDIFTSTTSHVHIENNTYYACWGGTDNEYQGYTIKNCLFGDSCWYPFPAQQVHQGTAINCASWTCAFDCDTNTLNPCGGYCGQVNEINCEHNIGSVFQSKDWDSPNAFKLIHGCAMVGSGCPDSIDGNTKGFYGNVIPTGGVDIGADQHVPDSSSTGSTPRPATYAYSGWKYFTPYVTGHDTSAVIDATIIIPLINISAPASDLRAAKSDGTHLTVSTYKVKASGSYDTIGCLITFPTVPTDSTVIFFYSGLTDPIHPPDADSFSLYDRLRYAPNVQVMSTGINDFDILHTSTGYHLFSTANSLTMHRRADNPPGLDTAHIDTIYYGGSNANNLYPTVIYDSVHSVWHVWAVTPYNSTHTMVYHDTGVTPIQFYSHDTTTMIDFKTPTVRQGPDGNFYCSCYKGGTGAFLHIFKSPTVNGGWVDQGDVFSVIGRAGWHANGEGFAQGPGYEYNTYLGFYKNRAYVMFDGLDPNGVVRSGIAEFNISTCKAITQSVVTQDSTKHCGNPCFLDDGINGGRVYYTYHNVVYQQDTTPDLSRPPFTCTKLDFNHMRDLGSGDTILPWGTATARSSGLTIPSGSGGWYDCAGQCNIYDFTMRVTFNPSSIPGTAVLMGAFYGVNGSAPFWNITTYLGSTGKILYSLQNASAGGSSFQNFGSHTSNIGGTNTVVFKRQAGSVKCYLNGALDYTSTDNDTISGMLSVTVGNAKCFYSGAIFQFLGTISNAEFYSAAIQTSYGVQDSTLVTEPPGVLSLDSIRPNHGLWKDTVKVFGSYFGTTQGTSTIALGDSNVSVVNWSDTILKIIVPNIDTGFYNIDVNDGLTYDTLYSAFYVGPINYMADSVISVYPYIARVDALSTTAQRTVTVKVHGTDKCTPNTIIHFGGLSLGSNISHTDSTVTDTLFKYPIMQSGYYRVFLTDLSWTFPVSDTLISACRLLNSGGVITNPR